MAVTIHDDYPTHLRGGVRGANTCSACHSGGGRIIKDPLARTGRPERVVDFSIDIDYEGWLMLCEQCIVEAAVALGMVTPGARDSALMELEQLRVEVETLRSERDEARELFRAIRSYDAHDSLESSEVAGEPEAASEPAEPLQVEVLATANTEPKWESDHPVRVTKVR